MRRFSTFALSIVCAAFAQAFPRYAFTDLGDLPGGLDASYGADVNEAGTVVGTATTSAGQAAFVWTRAGGMVPLSGKPGFGQSTVYGINIQGVVSGVVHDGNWPTGYRPVLWSANGQLVDLGLPSGVEWALSAQINDHGDAVTWGGTSAGRRALVWRKAGGWQVVAPPAGSSECGFSSINSKGQICGWADEKPMVYVDGSWRELAMPAGSLDAFPNFITDEGRVGGYVRVGPGEWDAGQWNLAGEFLQSPRLPGFASMDCFTASHEGGLISGSSYSNDFERATLWSPVDGLVAVDDQLDPSTPGWSLNALVLRRNGLLVGWGVKDGATHACVGVPVATPTDARVVFGRMSSGGVSSLATVDGDMMEVCKFIVPNPSVSPVTVEFEAPCAVRNPHVFRLRATSRMATAGAFQQTLELYDWQLGGYSPVDARTDALGTTASTFELLASGNAGRYVGPGRTVRARVRIKPNGPAGSGAWCARFDRVEFVAQL